MDWVRACVDDEDITAVLADVRAGATCVTVSGLAASARAVFTAAMHDALKRPIVVVTHNALHVQHWTNDLVACLDGQDVYAYPAHESVHAEMSIGSPDVSAARMHTLSTLLQHNRGILVTSGLAARKFVVSPRMLREATISVRVAMAMPLEQFVQRCVHAGYVRVPQVEHPGQISVRGGIVDVYPWCAGASDRIVEGVAYRLEWFGDTIESMRTIDVHAQRSIASVDEVTIFPCAELFGSIDQWEQAADRATETLQAHLLRMPHRHERIRKEDALRADIEKLRTGVPFAGRMKFVASVVPECATIAQYTADDAIWVFDEPTKLHEQAQLDDRDIALWAAYDAPIPQTIAEWPLCMTWADWSAQRTPRVQLTLFGRQSNDGSQFTVHSRTMPMMAGQMPVLRAEVARWQRQKTTVMLVAPQRERLKKMEALIREGGDPIIRCVEATMHHGFDLPGAQLVVITDKELLDARARRTRPAVRAQDDAVQRIKSDTELRVGDYVVHVHHGIGRFTGIGTIVIDDVHRDYVNIEYALGDKLAIPIEHIELIQKYIGADEGTPPKMSKLGGTEWGRARAKAQRAVNDIADELIKLYAARAAIPGHAFAPDTPYQQQFETVFPYPETPDQLRAIAEIKRDMEQARPMDRLLCGDVGYGKTEVAIRAACKAVLEGKQVAVLVPTTILAHQHYETFQQRFFGMPCRIAVLSRFRTKKDIDATRAGLKDGTIDICIGTHRLLSSDIVFRDIGLLIVDEEQRFGVAHKEKIKKFRNNVDVLTLTATPIPRTLHMAMIGVRDVSVIETPPENRHPVQTYVMELRMALVRDAIERELAREGQVYVVHNRIEGIERVAQSIREEVPDARVVVAHGQMKEDVLERTIFDFLSGSYDVLVSTSIIETGVDIPNVNTLIVYDADKMGLSQLYQLRGRVGRSNRIAYAYFTFQRDRVLKEAAEKRLQAIRELTELGSGFQIAMRDLAIRGAGDLLGGQQHGFIASVGFHLYTQMLADEMEKRKRDVHKEEQQHPMRAVTTKIDVPIEAYVPSTYIEDSGQKLEVYHMLAQCTRAERLDEIVEELIDRFGDVPLPVETLIRVARVRVWASQLGMHTISYSGHTMQFAWDRDWSAHIVPDKLARICTSYSNAAFPLRIVPQTTAVVQMIGNKAPVHDVLKRVETVLHAFVREGVVDTTPRSLIR
ncbi:MAG: transcription-repair coupling factor [Paenibacillaceae bacterium]|nr:transcription-repair coupling factor [Paenibacillaceae bacterium]